MNAKIILFLGLFLSTAINAQENNIQSLPDFKTVNLKINLKDAVMTADKQPEFPGGMTAFHRKVAENTEMLYLKKSQKLDTRIYFVIEKDGYIRNITAVGNDKKHVAAAELGLKRVFTRWKPATVNDEPVRYLYMFPLSTKKY